MNEYRPTQALVPAPPRRLSQVLRELAAETRGPVSVETIRHALGDRSFAALLIIFAAINLLPLPPGSSTVLGIPLIILTAQMMLRRTEVWLPRFVLRKAVPRKQFDYALARLIPGLERLERLIRPRYWPIPRGHTDMVIGLLGFVLALAVTIPIPFGNWPPAFACVLLGLALSERDGALLAVGIGVGTLALMVIAFVVGAAGATAGWVYQAVV